MCLRTASLDSRATVYNLLTPWPDTLPDPIAQRCHCKTLYAKELPRIRTLLLPYNLPQDTTKVLLDLSIFTMPPSGKQISSHRNRKEKEKKKKKMLFSS